MKKILSIALVLVLVLSLGATAFADADATFTKSYKLDADSDPAVAVSPAETFTFTAPECQSVEDGGVITVEGTTRVVGPEDAPAITIGTAEYNEGGATEAGNEKTIDITLGEFPAVGVYTYTFKEVKSETAATAGVTYFANDITLVVTVQQDDNGKFTAVAVHCESPVQNVYINKDGKKVDAQGIEITDVKKTDKFENTYAAGQLTVNKVVKGNMGDKSKDFEITVVFEAPEKTVINSTIDAKAKEVAISPEADSTTTKITYKFSLSDDTSAVFNNIPEGVSWTVSEANYSDDGYEAAISTESGDIDSGDEDKCTITNTKEIPVDTGITLDSLPYILIVAVVLAASVVMIVNKRRSEV